MTDPPADPLAWNHADIIQLLGDHDTPAPQRPAKPPEPTRIRAEQGDLTIGCLNALGYAANSEHVRLSALHVAARGLGLLKPLRSLVPHAAPNDFEVRVARVFASTLEEINDLNRCLLPDPPGPPSPLDPERYLYNLQYAYSPHTDQVPDIEELTAEYAADPDGNLPPNPDAAASAGDQAATQANTNDPAPSARPAPATPSPAPSTSKKATPSSPRRNPCPRRGPRKPLTPKPVPPVRQKSPRSLRTSPTSPPTPPKPTPHRAGRNPQPSPHRTGR